MTNEKATKRLIVLVSALLITSIFCLPMIASGAGGPTGSPPTNVVTPAFGGLDIYNGATKTLGISNLGYLSNPSGPITVLDDDGLVVKNLTKNAQTSIGAYGITPPDSFKINNGADLAECTNLQGFDVGSDCASLPFNIDIGRGVFIHDGPTGQGTMIQPDGQIINNVTGEFMSFISDLGFKFGNNISGIGALQISPEGKFSAPLTGVGMTELVTIADDNGFQIQNSAGTTFFQVDGTNGIISNPGPGNLPVTIQDADGFLIKDVTFGSQKFKVSQDGLISSPSGIVTIADSNGFQQTNDAGTTTNFKVDGIGQMSNPSGNVTVNDGFDVKNNLQVYQTASVTGATDLWSDLTIHDADLALIGTGGGIDAAGNILGRKDISANGNMSTAGNLSVYGKILNEAGGAVAINDALDVAGNITSTGKMTATGGFGTVYFISNYNASATSLTATCNPGDIAMSCEAISSQPLKYVGPSQNLCMIPCFSPTNDGCQAQSTVAGSLRAVARCWKRN